MAIESSYTKGSNLLTSAKFLTAAIWLVVLGIFWFSAESKAAAETIHFSGSLDRVSVERLIEVNKAKPPIWLRITSDGGEVEAGIRLGYWIFRNHIGVVVKDFCLSSCANYVFPAASEKVILPGSIVAWHGNYHHLKLSGLWKDDIQARMRNYGESRVVARRKAWELTEHLVQMERKFFQFIGVNEKVCRIGKQSPYNVPNYYFLNLEDMGHFGIKRIRLEADYEKTDVSQFPFSIKFLRLVGD